MQMLLHIILGILTTEVKLDYFLKYSEKKVDSLAIESMFTYE
jgi:hypothetical protein